MEVFKLTEDQERVAKELRAQVANPNGKNLIVSGRGGVGKTVLIGEFVTRLIEEDFKVCVTAFTGKATGVIREKILDTLKFKNIEPKRNQLKIETLTKITKQTKVVNIDNDGKTVYSNRWNEPRLFNYDVLIIDELSMVPNHFALWWSKTPARVFGFGDYCQIPPVESNIGKELESFKRDLNIEFNYVGAYGVKVLKANGGLELTKILRSTNEVAHLCNDLRDYTMNLTQIRGILKEWDKKSDNIFYSKSLKDLKVDPEWQIIAYTNKMCKRINDGLSIGEDYPTVADKIIINDNLNPLKIYNGDVMIFGDFLKAIKDYNERRKDKIYVCMKWQGKMPNRESDSAIERNFYNNYRGFKQESVKVNNQRWVELKRKIMSLENLSDSLRDSILSFIDEKSETDEDRGKLFTMVIKRLEEIDIEMADLVLKQSARPPRLYMVDAGFGYSVTTHRCISGDTKINTNNGVKKIKNWQEGDLVDGKKPLSFYEYPASPLLKVSTEDGNHIKATPDHTAFVWEGNNKEIKPFKDLKIGDYFKKIINEEEKLVKITEITETEPEKVYCFRTESGGFLQNDFLLGNCQGSSYNKVCYLLEKFDKPLLYTGVSRAREQVMIIDLIK